MSAMNLELDYIDYPTAWAIQKAGLTHTDERCSAVQTSGALLCDCDALMTEWARLKVESATDSDEVHIDDSDICEDCGERHAWTVCREITTRGGKHRCRGCDDQWTETRGADAIDTVRWPGWFA